MWNQDANKDLKAGDGYYGRRPEGRPKEGNKMNMIKVYYPCIKLPSSHYFI